MKKKFANYFKNIFMPAFLLSVVTGILTGVLLVIFKFCVNLVIKGSNYCYEIVKEKLYLIPVCFVILFLLSLLVYHITSKESNAKGGGIPNSIGILRDVISFKWVTTLLGVFFASLITFFIGVPLGNEGPSVQLGTCVGRGVSKVTKNKAWDRYIMSGGASSGFAVATGSILSGFLFSLEEAHQRISPMIIIVSFVSVLSSYLTVYLLAPYLGVSISLFNHLNESILPLVQYYIPLLVGIIFGILSALFLRLFKIVSKFSKKISKKVKQLVIIFSIFLLTFLLGLVNNEFLSTGHHLLTGLLNERMPYYLLIIILVVRVVLLLISNTNGISGGLFVPLLAIGGLIGALLGNLFIDLNILDESYYSYMVALGITLSMAGLMKTPLISLVFGVEVFYSISNLPSLAIAIGVTYLVTEILGTKSINDRVLENKIRSINEGKTLVTYEVRGEIKTNSFAIGKSIRDILWPNNLYVLSLTHGSDKEIEVDEHGDSVIREKDILHMRFSTYNLEESKEKIITIIGPQDLQETIIKKA